MFKNLNLHCIFYPWKVLKNFIIETWDTFECSIQYSDQKYGFKRWNTLFSVHRPQFFIKAKYKKWKRWYFFFNTFGFFL